MASNFFMKALLLSISGSLIACLLFIIMHLFKNKLSKTWRYYICLTVLFRMLLPYQPEMSVLGLFCQFLDDNTQLAVFSEQALVNKTIMVILNFVGIAWLCIALFLIFKKSISYFIYTCFIKRNRKIVTDRSILRIYHEVCREKKIAKKITLYTYPQINSPMLVGFFKPYILLPEAMLKIDTRNCPLDTWRYILLHELTHYKRKDFLYQFLLWLASCLHFFNPIMHIICNRIKKECEFSCDEMVIKNFDPQEKKAYGFALIYTLEMNAGYHQHTIPSFMLCEDIKQIKDRLDAIYFYHHRAKRIWAATFLLSILICFSSIHVGVFNNIFYTKTCNCNVRTEV